MIFHVIGLISSTGAAVAADTKKAAEKNIVVLPLGGEVQVTDGSLVYALPLTVFEIDIVAERKIEIPAASQAFFGDVLHPMTPGSVDRAGSRVQF